MLLPLLFISTAFTQCTSEIIFDADPIQQFDPRFGYFFEITEGSPFTMQCRNEFSFMVHFSATDLLNNVGFTLSDFENGFSWPATNSIRYNKPNTTMSDSGSYDCFVKGFEEETKKSIYLFVKGDKFFVAKKNLKIAATGKRFTIPCTSTSPDTNVHLYQNGKETDYLYKPTNGFRLPTQVLTSRNANFTCKHNASKESISFIVDLEAMTRTTF